MGESNATSAPDDKCNIMKFHEPDLSSLNIDSETFRTLFAEPQLICRLCLRQKQDMIARTTQELHQCGIVPLLEAITAIPFDHSSGYSLHICRDCEANIQLVTRIRSEFIQADKLWKIYLAALTDNPQNIFPTFFDCKDTISSVPTTPAEVHYENVKVELLDDVKDDLCAPWDDGKKLFDVPFDPLTPTKQKIKRAKSRPTNQFQLKKQTSLKILKSKTEIQPYSCDICLTRRNIEVRLQSKSQLRAHIKGHVNLCRICTDCFFSRAELEFHQTMCFPILRDQCHWCDTKISTEIRKHVVTNHPNVLWPECDQCGAKFAHKKYLLHHWQKRHLKAKTFKCSFCSKAFGQRSYLVHHERVHTGEKPYVCEICARGFAQVTALKQHLLLHSKQLYKSKTVQPQPPLGNNCYCPLCTYATPNIQTLKYHMHRKHGSVGKREGNNLYSLHCMKCNLFFESKEERNAHLKQHLIYKCDFCTKHFSNCDAVQLHMRIHKQTHRPHICNICGATFASVAHLRRHHRFIHETESHFQCDQCPRKFPEKYQLNRHKDSDHLNIRKSLKCEHCPKEFLSVRGLDNHRIKKHTVTNRFTCSLCLIVTESANQLGRHHQRYHSNFSV